MRESAHGLANSLIASKEVKAPLVILKKVSDGVTKYVGFVPGLLFKDVEDVDIESVKTKLTKMAKQHINNMLNNNTEFPFFPNKQQIIEDYPETVFIKYIKIK